MFEYEFTKENEKKKIGLKNRTLRVQNIESKAEQGLKFFFRKQQQKERVERKKEKMVN